MRFGLFVTNQFAPGEDHARRFAEMLEYVRLARDLGFSTILSGQHFLSDPFPMLQPVAAVARMAAEAGTMRVGVGIFLLPLLNPVQVAEDAASLDVISGGRFIFGAGLGYREEEDAAFGLGKGQRVPRLAENLEVIRRLWCGEAVSLDRADCRLAGARLSLRPLQRPHPPVWIAANNDAAVARAAALGDAWIINPHAKLETIARQMGIYREALRAAGKSFPADLPMIREIAVAETRAEAVRAVRPFLERKYQAYVRWGQHRVLPQADDMTVPFDDLVGDRFILGSPAECAEAISRCAAATGATEMIFRLHWPGMDHATVLRSLRLLGEQVRPGVAA